MSDGHNRCEVTSCTASSEGGGEWGGGGGSQGVGDCQLMTGNRPHALSAGTPCYLLRKVSTDATTTGPFPPPPTQQPPLPRPQPH